MNDPGILRILRDAKTILVERGWCQGAYAKGGTPEGRFSSVDPRAERFCVVGAVLRAADEAYPEALITDRAILRLRAQLRMRQAAEEVLGEKTSPALYNDTPGRTRDEVVALIDKAIEMEEGDDE